MIRRSPSARLRGDRPSSRRLKTDGQLFFAVCPMKPPSCGVTFVPLHFGHVTFAPSCSEMVMVRSKGFLHFSQRYSYLGMGLSPDSVLVSVSVPRQIFVCPYSMISSARARTDGGMIKSSACAV